MTNTPKPKKSPPPLLEGLPALSHPRLFAVLCILAVALAGSAGTISNGFTNWDDPELVIECPQVHDLSQANIIRVFTSVTDHAYLPVRTLSYAVDYAVWGLNPVGFHLTNILLHCATCILVFLLLSSALRDDRIAILASLLFAVHPVHVEAVAWISGRKDLLVAFFSILALLACDRRTPSRRDPQWIILAGLLAACACLSKPTAVVLPFLALIVSMVRRSDAPSVPNIIQRALDLWPLFLVCAACAVIHFAVGLSQEVIKAGATAPFAAAAETLRLLWFPVHLSPLYVVHGALVAPAILPLTTIAVVATAGLLAWRLRAREAALTLGLLWLAIAYLPTSNILPTSVPLAERYLYLPSLGFCICLAAVFVKAASLSGRRTAMIAGGLLPAVLVAVLGAGTLRQAACWRDSLSLWRSAVEVFPSSTEAWNDLAAAYSEAGMDARAGAALETSARLEPPTARLHLNRGIMLMRRQEYPEAVRELTQACPDKLLAYSARYHMGQVFEAMKKDDAAMEQYHLAAALSPRSPAPLNNLGVLYERHGDLKAAREAYEKAIATDPGYALAYYNLGNLEQAEKNRSAAETAYRKAIALSPDHAMSHNNLASIYLDLHEADLAKEEFEQAADLAPTLIQPLLALAVINASEGDKEAALAAARRALDLDPKNPTALRVIEKLGK